MGNSSPEIQEQGSNRKGQMAAFVQPCFSSTIRLNWVHQQWWPGLFQNQQGWQPIQMQSENFCKSHQCKPNLLILSKCRSLVFRLALAPRLQRALGVQGCPFVSLFKSPPSSAQENFSTSLPSCGCMLEMRAWTSGMEMLAFWEAACRAGKGGTWGCAKACHSLGVSGWQRCPLGERCRGSRFSWYLPFLLCVMKKQGCSRETFYFTLSTQKDVQQQQNLFLTCVSGMIPSKCARENQGWFMPREVSSGRGWYCSAAQLMLGTFCYPPAQEGGTIWPWAQCKDGLVLLIHQ